MALSSLTILGGLVGAAFGVFLSDPYRTASGQFTTRKTGFGNWIFQAGLGGVVGAILTPMVYAVLVANPLIVGLALIIGLYAVYRTHVDPR